MCDLRKDDPFIEEAKCSPCGDLCLDCQHLGDERGTSCADPERGAREFSPAMMLCINFALFY